MNKRSKILGVIGKLNSKYWHLPFGDTSKWLLADRLLLEKAIRFYDSLGNIKKQ